MIVLITGGTAGIGAATAKQLKQEGHRVIVAGRRVETNFSETGISTLQMDVTSEKSVITAVKNLYNTTKRIDVVVQCAGRGAIGPLEAFHTDEIADVFNLNLYGILRVNQAVIPIMRQQGCGRIILISSLAAEAGLPFQSVYCAGKAALDIMIESLRMEIKPFGIDACVLQPGDFKTEVALHRKLPDIDSESPYKNAFEEINLSATNKVDVAGDPIKVARTISQLLKKNKLAPKYRVGSPIELAMPWVKVLIPASLFERLLTKYYGL
ncbi:SDR family oxidoreductase [Sunxiuqinia indica]|uniref:SDR family oxidoreductase n=1 Tax=Sunxiuqinia indica TaxID=2692584 RepID=UPI001357CB88|nr:SDR family oxidoreductase [Sunxiuqinia indica]